MRPEPADSHPCHFALPKPGQEKLWTPTVDPHEPLPLPEPAVADEAQMLMTHVAWAMIANARGN